MLFKRLTLDRIETGEVTVAFRKWRRPSVKKDGTLKTRVGLLGMHFLNLFDPSRSQQWINRSHYVLSEIQNSLEIPRRQIQQQ